MADYPNPAWGTKNWYLNELVQLEDNLYTYANKDNTRTFVLVTDKGVVVGDPISDEDARSLRQKIRAVTNLPVTHVIYSHNHWDHIKGARIFKEEGATIISHVGCRAKFIDRPHPKVVMPDYTFDGDHILDVGNERIELRYFGENHSSCLVFPLLKGGKYMFVVDVVSPGAVPWGIVPDTNFVGSIRTLEQLEKIDFKIAIPGHGAPMVPKSALTERRLYITALYEAVRDELAPAGFQPSFYTNVERRMEPWSYLRSFKTQFRQNLETMLYYVGIGE
jgi:glyoxylase-like metal-dependent hydrolase (beta-lactamase superfamily II)